MKFTATSLSSVLCLVSYAAASGPTLLGFDEDTFQARDVDHALTGATLIGFDERSNEIHAYTRDHIYLGRFPADVAARHLSRSGSSLKARQDVGNCGPLKSEQLDQITGYGKLEEFRKGLFGDGDHFAHLNPQQEPDDRVNPPKTWNLADLKAERCIASDPIGTLELVGDPACDKQTTTVDGTIVGTNGTSTITHTIGETVSMTHTVTNSEKVGISASFSATFGVPAVSSQTITAGFSFDYSHEDAKANTQEKASTSTQALAIASPSGKHCRASLDSETCHAKAKGNIKTFVSGWVWWSYKDKVRYNKDFAQAKNINFNDDGKHWSWAITMEGLLSEEDRILYTPLSTTIGTTQVNAMYNATCE